MNAVNNGNVPLWLGEGLDLLFCHLIVIPPRMQNSAQFGNLITSAAETVLVNARRRCKACVVFLCLARQRFVYSMM